MEKVIVIGGSGFIGRALQEQVLNQQTEDSFVFAYNKHPERIGNGLDKTRLDLLGGYTIKALERYPTAIYVSGSADHRLAKECPSLDLDLNVKAFLNFMEKFRGSLVLLSSQAVYYGLENEILENVDHVSTMPYGLSKQMTEAYAKYFLTKGSLSKLWIFRLMYAFGKGEKERRLIPQCAKATYSNERVTILGGGKSFLNPLPSWFVAKILIEAIENLKEKGQNFLEITNMNFPQKVTVSDVVRFLAGVRHFDYVVSESGEDWPVKFWGNTKNLSAHMKEWNMNFPNVWDSLKNHLVELTKGEEHG
jgi:nucleoside-diphosphate-sugar epimerase